MPLGQPACKHSIGGGEGAESSVTNAMSSPIRVTAKRRNECDDFYC